MQIPYLTFWEVVHYWFHAACEVLVANDYTRKIGENTAPKDCITVGGEGRRQHVLLYEKTRKDDLGTVYDRSQAAKAKEKMSPGSCSLARLCYIYIHGESCFRLPEQQVTRQQRASCA